MKQTFLVEIDSVFSINPYSVKTALMTLPISNATVEFKGSVTTIPAPKPVTFEGVRFVAEQAANIAVNEYVAKYGEPMYCGTAYLYRANRQEPVGRQRKARYVTQDIHPTGFAGRTQSLDIQELWCRTASKVFEENGIVVNTKSWVD